MALAFFSNTYIVLLTVSFIFLARKLPVVGRMCLCTVRYSNLILVSFSCSLLLDILMDASCSMWRDSSIAFLNGPSSGGIIGASST